ncbi:MAG: TrmH family RNA methyltransferase [Sandaracinaceae bacterium]
MSARDTHLTVYGKQPVLSVLEDEHLTVARVFVVQGQKGDAIARIVALAEARRVPVERTSAERVSRISRRPAQDQGVAADVKAPAMRTLEAFLEGAGERCAALALDGITTPANVGMILRSATVLGVDAVIVPSHGVAEISPLVIKASAGLAFRAPIVRCRTLDDALSDAKLAGFGVLGLSDAAEEPLFGASFFDRSIFVLGNEAVGVGDAVRPLVDRWLAIPMSRPGDSLNVAAAGAIVAAELARRRVG